MDRMDWMTTLKVAHMLADLPRSEKGQELPELADILGLDKVTYTFTDEYGSLSEVKLLVQEFPLEGVLTYYSLDLLHSYGEWNEVWTRMVVQDLDMAGTPYWERDNDLSAMLGYGSEDSECGVFYHKYDEGVVEFKVNTPYNEMFYDPFHLLNHYFYKNWRH